MGIKITSKKEGEQLKKALESEKFKRILESLSFSNYQIDWRMFDYFKQDFYNYFLDNEIKSKSSTKTRKSPSPPKSTKTIKKKKLNIVSELKGGKKSNKTLKKR